MSSIRPSGGCPVPQSARRRRGPAGAAALTLVSFVALTAGCSGSAGRIPLALTPTTSGWTSPTAASTTGAPGGAEPTTTDPTGTAPTGGDATATGPTTTATGLPGVGATATSTDPAVADDSVLAPLSAQAKAPTTDGLRAVLTPLFAPSVLGTRVSAVVFDGITGAALYGWHDARPATPASTVKILTSVAALQSLGAQTTLPTSVVGTTPTGPVYLVGGGDQLLAAGHGSPAAVNGRAGLADLADLAAAALKKAGRHQITLRLDDHLFTEARARDWAPGDGDVHDGYVAPIMALAVDDGIVKVQAGRAVRADDPALKAATIFAKALKARGITVSGAVRRGTAPASGAATLATVHSAPVAQIVEHLLTVSDNTAAEALARVVAVRQGLPGTFAGAGAGVTAVLRGLGVPLTGVKLTGGSGLGRSTVVTPRALASGLSLAASADHPGLRSVLTGLPIAGGSGTLDQRFGSRAQARALGVVRAKTGTLTGVNALAGVVVDADQRLLIFAVIADRTQNALTAESALDRIAGTLASCGCR